ncbi:MAG: glycosyltransferase family 39 protein [Gemmatimonadaceae bacterium]
MTTRASVASVAPWAGIALVLLFALHDRFDLVQNRVLILLGLAVAAVGIALRRGDAVSASGRSPEARAIRRRTMIAVALLGAASVGLVLLRAIVAPKLGLRADVLAALVPPLLGWSVFLLLPIGLAPASDTRTWEPRLPGSVAIALIAFVAIGLATFARTHFDNIDEVLYALQAHRFTLGDATWPLDPELQRFVKLPLMAVTPEGIYTQYPPGYPAILALFVQLGVPRLAGATLGALAVLGTYRIGRGVGSPPVGLVAALLLATNVVVLRWSAAFMSHAAAMAALCIAAWLAFDAIERAGRRRDVESVLAGVLIGVSVNVRPVTGLAIGLTIWLVLIVRRTGWPGLIRATVMMCLGGAIPVAALLAYNAATTGSPLQLGYQAALGHLNDVGFGRRGIILYGRDARPVVSAFEFTLADAVRNEITTIWPLARDLFPVWWLAPLVAVGVAYRMRVRWMLLAAFGVLPIVNFFFFGNSERLYVELLPFALIGAALLVRHVGTVDPRAAHALLIFLVGANVVTSATRIADDRWQHTRHPPVTERLARTLRDSSRAAPRILVFVRDTTVAEPLLIGLSQFNFGRFPGPVVVARDLGAENARLACRLPGYRVLVAEFAPAARDARLVSSNDASLVASRCRPALVSIPRPSA